MSKVVAKQAESKVAVVPDYLATYGNSGNETVGVDDIIIPRLGLIQQLSPELDNSDTKFIEGAKAGDLFNSLTREVYGHPLKVVFVDRRKEYVVFKKRSAGGGFKGSFQSVTAANEFINTQDNYEQLEVVETATNFAIVLDDNDHPVSEVVLSLTSTKLKVDRAINSMIKLRGAARFASIFFLDSIKEKNDKGTFHNLKVNIGPWVPPEVAEIAKKMYDAIHAGKRVVDHEVETVETADF